MIRLRPYQRDAVDATHTAFEDGCTAPAIGLPTGTGKTIVFSQIVEERAHLGRALILAHRDELLRQAAEKYLEVNPAADIGFVQAGENDIDHDVVVASVQSLCQPRRLEAFPFDEFATIVVDEAHHAVAPTYRRILDLRREGSLLIGVSATLERGDKVGLGAVWERVVYLRTLQEMIEEGYLVDIRALAVRLEYNMGQLRTSHGDFVASQVGEMLDAVDAYSVTANAFLEHGADRKALIFTPTVAAAHRMAETFSAAGVPAEAVDGRMPIDARRVVLGRLRSGETSVVANAMVLTEGFDEPSVDCIIVARPTKSRPLYVQMVGRGTRLFPGKEHLLVLDLVGNTERVDLQSLPRLFGVKWKDCASVGAAEGLRLVESDAKAKAGLWDPRKQGQFAEVDLFERKDINWLRLADGRWLLGIGEEGELLLEQRPDGKWDAVRRWYSREAKKPLSEPLGEGLDIGYAMGVAEEYLREDAGNGAKAIAGKSAGWRSQPPTPKQLALLAKLGVEAPANATKGDASDLISAALASRGPSRATTAAPGHATLAP